MTRRRLYAFITTFILFSSGLAATELKPWHGSMYSTEFQDSILLQQFTKIDNKCGTQSRSEVDLFYNVGVLGVPDEDFTLELEASALNTRHRSFGFSAIRFTGRYFLSNDILAIDPVSVAIGFTASKIFEAARTNIATFDHGGVACEAHIAIGKEYSCRQFWLSRIWGVLGLGIADVGYPWLRANLVWERNWWELHQVKVFADSIWGFGGRHMPRYSSFRGYGTIDYQAIDVGARYSYRFYNDALFGIGYAYRAYGRNCPINVNLVKIDFYYPFSF